MKKKSIFSGLFLLLGTLLIFYVLSITVFAASLYNVTETTATVGTNAPLEIEYTVDTAVQTWADADTLTLTLPNNFPDWSALTFTAENDKDVNNNGAGPETAITVGGGNGQYAIAGKVITVKWNVTGWGAVGNGAETIRFLITGSNLPTYAGATSTFTFGGTTTAADTNPSGTDTVNVSVGALTSTNIEPSSFTVSTSTTNTISFTSTTVIPNLGKIVLTYPSGWNVSGANTLTAGSLSGLDGTWTAGVAGQVITLTQTGGAQSTAGAKSLTLAGIVNPASSGNGGTYTIQTQIADGSAIEQDAAVTSDNITTNATSVSLLGLENLTVTDDVASGGVLLKWDKPSNDDSTHVHILRVEEKGVLSATPIGIVTKDIKKFIDLTAVKGVTYKYAVRTTDGTAYGTTSKEVLFKVGSTIIEEQPLTEDSEPKADEPADEPVAENPEPEDTETGTEVTGAEEEGAEEGLGEAEEEGAAEEEEPAAVTLKDIGTHWAKTEVQAMVDKGIVKGYKDGSFKPNNNLNRAEAAILLCRVLGIDETETASTKPFGDVDGKSWYGGCVSALKTIKIVKGNPDGTYKPITNINRAEFLALAIRTYSEMLDEEEQTDLDAKLNATTFTESFSDVGKTAWYANVASVAKDLGFVQSETFEGGANITRAEAVTVLFRIFDETL